MQNRSCKTVYCSSSASLVEQMLETGHKSAHEGSKKHFCVFLANFSPFMKHAAALWHDLCSLRSISQSPCQKAMPCPSTAPPGFRFGGHFQRSALLRVRGLRPQDAGEMLKCWKNFFRKLQKCMLLADISKIFPNLSLNFRAFGWRIQFFGKFWKFSQENSKNSLF